MIRVPELKKQAALLESEIKAAMLTPLQHSVALEIVAKLNGFKNWRHAASDAAQIQVTKAVQPKVVSQKIELAMVFGSEDTRALDDSEVVPENLDTYSLKAFNTEAEMLAYLEGINDMEGWVDYAVVRDPVKDFLTEYAPEEDPAAIRTLLAEQGFFPSSHAYEEFNRDLRRPSESEDSEAPAYQFIIFQKDDVTGERFVNMDCSMHEGGEYLTETPIFTGATVREALLKALEAAGTQYTDALDELTKLSNPAQ